MKRLSESSNKLYSLDDVAYGIISGSTDTLLYCAEAAVTSAESYSAGVQDIKAEKSLICNKQSFPAGCQKVRYQGIVYVIYRIYDIGNGQLQLYLTIRAGVR